MCLLLIQRLANLKNLRGMVFVFGPDVIDF